jgi:hypothetical protein
MRPKSNIILFIIFILLGAYVYFFETGSKEKNYSSEESQKVLRFNPEDVEEIKLKIQGSAMVLKKKDQQWRIVSPMQTDAIKSKVDSLLSVFEFPVIRVIDTNPLDLSEYGLNKPKFELGLRMKGENVFKTLHVGNNSPQGLNCYAKLEGNPEVLLIGRIYETKLNINSEFFTGE